MNQNVNKMKFYKRQGSGVDYSTQCPIDIPSFTLEELFPLLCGYVLHSQPQFTYNFFSLELFRG